MYCYFRFRKLFLFRKSVKNYTRIIIASWQTIINRIIFIYIYKRRGIDKISRNANESSYIRKISNRFDTFTEGIFSTKWLRCIRLKNIGSASDIRGRKLKLITFGRRTLSKHLRLFNGEDIFDGFKKFKELSGEMPGDIEYGWNLYIRVEELHKILKKKKKEYQLLNRLLRTTERRINIKIFITQRRKMYAVSVFNFDSMLSIVCWKKNRSLHLPILEN